MNYSSNFSIIAIDGNTNSTLIDDSSTSPYNERVIIVLMYFGVSIIFVFPILMFLLCLYKMRGGPPCDNIKQACCCEFC
jgi:hypothetical protein